MILMTSHAGRQLAALFLVIAAGSATGQSDSGPKLDTTTAI
jgi:hypothetical protein